MKLLETTLLRIYFLQLQLYPSQFRLDFAAEMHAVFADALSAASQEGLWAMLRLCSRELFSLPQALAREHYQSGRKEEPSMGKPVQISTVSPAASPAVAGQGPVQGWRDVLLAMLPFLVILLVDVLVRMFVASGLLARESIARQPLNITVISLLIITLLVGLVLAWRQKWPVWSAVWYPLFLLPPVTLVGRLLSLLFNPQDMQDALWYLLIPFTLAALLYTVTRLDRLRGLLAALPVLYLLWLPNMESVPDGIQVAIKLPSTILICLTIAYLLRRGDWRSGLYAVLAMNLAVGALYSYAGIYYGGTLPYVAPGPNLVEVLRSLVPQYLAGGAILLGPLFARIVRQAARSSSSTSRVSYHISLAGLMLVFLVVLYSLMKGTSSSKILVTSTEDIVLSAVILLGIAVYLAGLFLTYQGARNAAARPGWLEHILLAVLPLAIPLTFVLPFITWKWPLSKLYGVPLLWELPHAVSLSIGLVWLALSVWLVTRETGGSPAAVVISPALSDPKILGDL